MSLFGAALPGRGGAGRSLCLQNGLWLFLFAALCQLNRFLLDFVLDLLYFCALNFGV